MGPILHVETCAESDAELLTESDQERERDHETCTNFKKDPIREGPNKPSKKCASRTHVLKKEEADKMWHMFTLTVIENKMLGKEIDDIH